MNTARSVCLSIEFDFEDERVTGWLADEQGNDWAFSSWLDLLTLIERVLADARMSPAIANRSSGTRAAPPRKSPRLPPYVRIHER